jgi:hypothetical protein
VKSIHCANTREERAAIAYSQAAERLLWLTMETGPDIIMLGTLMHVCAYILEEIIGIHG